MSCDLTLVAQRASLSEHWTNCFYSRCSVQSELKARPPSRGESHHQINMRYIFTFSKSLRQLLLNIQIIKAKIKLPNESQCHLMEN